MVSEEVEKRFNGANHFSTEREMSEYIHKNIVVFCDEILGDEYLGHRREYNLIGEWDGTKGKRPINNGRVDFFIRCKNKEYAVEIKNPTEVFSEMTKSLGQIMVYRELLIQSGKEAELVLVTSKHAGMLDRIIARYDMNIRYIVFNKEDSVEVSLNG